MRLLFQTDLLNDLHPKNVIPESVEFTVLAEDKLQIKFAGHRHSLTTKAFEVSSFRHWGNLDNVNAHYYEYCGPDMIIYNETNDYVKSIDEHFDDFIMATCQDHKYEDKRLSCWRILHSGKPKDYPVKTQVKSVWPWTLMYCYPGKITMNNVTRDCSPTSFSLNASQAWSTPEYGDYVPTSVQISTRTVASISIVKTEDVHFNDSSHWLDLESAAHKLRELMKTNLELSSQSEWVIPRTEYRMSFKWTAYIMIALLALWLINYLANLLRFLASAKKANDREAVRRRRRSA